MERRSCKGETTLETDQRAHGGSSSNSAPWRRLNLSNKAVKGLLLLSSCILVSVGQVAGPLLLRIYYLHGGDRRWLSACLLSAGFPIMILPVAISYAKARSRARATTSTTGVLLVTPGAVAGSAVVGLILGLTSYLYSFGMSYLPVSVSSLLSTSQLAFTAIFAFIVVKQKFTHYSINAVVLMTLGSLVLGLHMDGDRPDGVSNGKYILGFFMTLGGAALHGLLYPAMERLNSMAGSSVHSSLIMMQNQLLLGIFATLFCTAAMIINKDFQAIPKEAAEFGLGESKYYLILIMAVVAWEVNLIGTCGIIFYSSSLFAGIMTSLLVPVQQIFAVIFLPETFNAEKGMALAMSLWGFASYFVGEYNLSNKKLEENKHRTEEIRNGTTSTSARSTITPTFLDV